MAKKKKATKKATKKSAPIEFDPEDWAKNQQEDTPEFLALRAENKRLRKKLSVAGATASLIVRAVHEALDEPPKFVIPKPPPQKKMKLDEVAVVHVSDTQIGKVTETYDSEIAAGRLMEFAMRVGRVIRRHQTYAKVDELRVYLGGDMVEGELIFPHQAHLIDSSVFEQAVRGAPVAISNMILYWLNFVEKIHVLGVPGNHGRPASKHAGSHPLTNWDSVCYQVVRLMIEGPDGDPNRDARKRITFLIPDNWYAVDEVLGHRNLVIHGHQIRGMIGGPAFARQVMGWRDAVPEPWDNIYFGHFHVYKQGDLNGRWWFCNGTTESDNDYALERLSSSTTPRQRLQFFSEKYGLTADQPIYLTHALERGRG